MKRMVSIQQRQLETLGQREDWWRWTLFLGAWTSMVRLLRRSFLRCQVVRLGLFLWGGGWSWCCMSNGFQKTAFRTKCLPLNVAKSEKICMYIIIYIYITGFNSPSFVPLGSLTIHDQPVSVPSSNLLAFPIRWQWNFEVLQLPGFLAPVFQQSNLLILKSTNIPWAWGVGVARLQSRSLSRLFRDFAAALEFWGMK